MIFKIQKIICITVTASVLLICGGKAHAFGFPMFMKTYLADAMRDYATTQMAKAQTSQEHNNLKLVEEAIERGNFIEVALIYDKIGSVDWDRFGNDPFGYVTQAAEKQLKKEANEYISAQRKKGEDYLKQQLASDSENKDQGQNQDQDQSKDQEKDGEKKTGDNGLNSKNDTESQSAAEKRRDEKYKTQVFNWYKNTRSMLKNTTSVNVEGVAKDVTDIIGDNSESDQGNSKKE